MKIECLLCSFSLTLKRMTFMLEEIPRKCVCYSPSSFQDEFSFSQCEQSKKPKKCSSFFDSASHTPKNIQFFTFLTSDSESPVLFSPSEVKK